MVVVSGPEGSAAPAEALNDKAIAVIDRIHAKLTGKDFADVRASRDTHYSAVLESLRAEWTPILLNATRHTSWMPNSHANIRSRIVVYVCLPCRCMFHPMAMQREALPVPAQVQRLIAQATSHENLCQCYMGWYVPRSAYCGSWADCRHVVGGADSAMWAHATVLTLLLRFVTVIQRL